MDETSSVQFADSYAVPATREELWEALTSPDRIREWHLCNVEKFEATEGGEIEFTASGQTVIKGRVTRVEPGELLEHTFRFTVHAEEPETLVTFKIEGHSTCSRLTLVHSGFPAVNVTFRDVVACWPLLICGLQESLRQRQYAKRNRPAA
ncbi:MAG: hypothetical protein AMXMBFR61_24110 [Fimbriimonadales bacterium]